MSDRDFKLYMAEDVKVIVEGLPARQRSAFINEAIRRHGGQETDLQRFGKWLVAAGRCSELSEAIAQFHKVPLREPGPQVINLRPDIPIGTLGKNGKCLWNGEEYVEF